MRGFLLPLMGSLVLFGGENLVPNGDLERGRRGRPLHWQAPDGLTSFWVKDPLRPGRCLRFDTDVLKTEARARWLQMERADPPPPRPKTPTRGHKYATIAASDGVPFFSDPIPVRPGQAYVLEVDFLPGESPYVPPKRLKPKVFIKGYVDYHGRPRVIYKIYKDCRGVPGRWTTNRLYFHPTIRTPRVQRIRVMLFPYWPPGTYYFDNIRIRPVPLGVWARERSRIRPHEKARRSPLPPDGKNSR